MPQYTNLCNTLAIRKPNVCKSITSNTCNRFMVQILKRLGQTYEAIGEYIYKLIKEGVGQF